jgi:dethiobiotin synthetase/adenosylmethionine--8-amino-7-oxononanoate aminotransferase
VWSFWDPEFVDELSRLESVKSVMTLGCVLAIKIDGGSGGKIHDLYTIPQRSLLLHLIQGYRSTAAQEILNPIRDTDPDSTNPCSFGIHFRTLGDLGYFITSLNTDRRVITKVEKRILEVLSGPGWT